MSGLGFAFLAIILFSLSLPMTKWALESFDPFFTATARAVIAALIALFFIWIKKVPIFHRKDLRAFLYTTAGAVFGWPILVALALNRTTTAQVAVIAAIMPLVTALIAVLRTHERASHSFWIGSALGTLILIFFALSRGGGVDHDLVADLLTLLAVFASSWCYVEGAALTKIYPGWQVISWVVIIALPINIPLSIFIWSRTNQNYSLTFHGIFGLLVIGIFSMYLGFFAWYKGLNQAGTVRGSQIQQLQAIFTLGWAVILLKEKVSITTLFSALGVIICVLWALSARNKTVGIASKQKSAIVIGAGVIGSSVAHQLAKSGWSVTVIDKANGPGEGSTSSSSAIIRFNYSTISGICLAWESFQRWKIWQEHLGATTDEVIAKMVTTGVLMIDVPVIDGTKTGMLFDKCGIPYEIWDADQLRERILGIDPGKFWPPKRLDDPDFFADATQSLGGIYTRDGGYINDPSLAAVNLADAAKRHGAKFRFKEKIIGIIKSENQVRGVTLASGEEVFADVLVNVAGPWSSAINVMAGIGSDFTVTTRPLRQEVHQVSAPPGLENMPFIGDLDTGMYIRATPGGAWLVGGTEPECEPLQWIDDPDTSNPNRTQELFQSQVMRAARRFPELKIPSEAKGVAGVYDVTEDWTPIYDKSELKGYYLAIGTSGNQFKNAPMAGILMKELIDAVESGYDHDKKPLIVKGEITGLDIDLGTFSRKRPRNLQSSGTVMG